VAEKSRNEAEASYKHLVELKKQNKQHITESLLTLNTLEVKLQEFTNKEARHKQQKARDLQAIETQRQHLTTTEVYNSRKLENEERILEDKFLTTKQEMKRKFIHDLDELKKNCELQIQALNQKHETNMSHVSHVMAGKIGDFQADCRALRREYDILSLEIKEIQERQDRLTQEYKKEKTITEANGTDSIEWLEKSGLNQEKRNMVVDLETTVNYLRQMLLESEDKLASFRKQKLANQEALKKSKQKLEGQYQAFQLLEYSKLNMETRQRKKKLQKSQKGWNLRKEMLPIIMQHQRPSYLLSTTKKMMKPKNCTNRFLRQRQSFQVFVFQQN